MNFIELMNNLLEVKNKAKEISNKDIGKIKIKENNIMGFSMDLNIKFKLVMENNELIILMEKK